MKKICFFLLIIFNSINIITAQEQITINYNAPIITFETELIDLGTFMQYDDPSSKCEFVFTNTGKEPLIISKAKGYIGNCSQYLLQTEDALNEHDINDNYIRILSKYVKNKKIIY